MTTASAPEPVPFTSADQYVGDRVAIEMRRRRLSQTAVAGHLGMGQSNLSKKLSGERGWSIDELLVMSRYFGLSVDALLPGDDYEPRVRVRSLENAETPGQEIQTGGEETLRARRDSNPKPSDVYPLSVVQALTAGLETPVTTVRAGQRAVGREGNVVRLPVRGRSLEFTSEAWSAAVHRRGPGLVLAFRPSRTEESA